MNMFPSLYIYIYILIYLHTYVLVQGFTSITFGRKESGESCLCAYAHTDRLPAGLAQALRSAPDFLKGLGRFPRARRKRSQDLFKRAFVANARNFECHWPRAA